MNLLDKTKRNTLFLITTVLLSSWIIGYLFLEYQFKTSVDEQYKERYGSIKKHFQINVEHEKDKMEMELEKLVSIDGLSKALFERDYNQINSIISPYYINLKKVHTDISILTFRMTDGTTLYRAHKPEFHGDKLNNKRKLIVDTNILQKSFSGFEVGKLDMTYRITQPIFYKGECVGNVEVGLDPRHFIDNLSVVFNIEIGVAIDKTLLSIMLDSDTVPIKNDYLLLKKYF